MKYRLDLGDHDLEIRAGDIVFTSNSASPAWATKSLAVIDGKSQRGQFSIGSGLPSNELILKANLSVDKYPFEVGAVLRH